MKDTEKQRNNEFIVPLRVVISILLIKKNKESSFINKKPLYLCSFVSLCKIAALDITTNLS